MSPREARPAKGAKLLPRDAPSAVAPDDAATALARQERLAAIKTAVAAGSYRVSSDEIAEKLIRVMRER